jgi:Phage integrase family
VRIRDQHEAVDQVLRYAAGLRFHDLRHSDATWLVSSGVAINDVSAMMGHEQTSTMLDRYTHPSPYRNERVRSVFADFSLTQGPIDTAGHRRSAARRSMILLVGVTGFEPAASSSRTIVERPASQPRMRAAQVKSVVAVNGGVSWS